MYKLLFSGTPPLGTVRSSSWNGHEGFRERWLDLASKSKEISVCVGYVSNDATAELKSILKSSKPDLSFHLTLGMAKFQGLPKSQLESLLDLQEMLHERQMGTVNVVKSWPYHGKVSVFTGQDGKTTAILGSSNLSGIVKSTIQYECDIEITDPINAESLALFSSQLREFATKPLDGTIRTIRQKSEALENLLEVRNVPDDELRQAQQLAQSSPIKCEMPIKVGTDASRSNINAFFGQGRVNTQRSFTVPRPWYEVELQPGREWFRQNEEFPEARQRFSVITDDGYSFTVYSSYDRSFDGPKNFRSDGDLQILGRWIKGRLEAAEVLKPGDLVSESTLHRYGRNSISLSRIRDGLWYMDFGVVRTL